MLLNELINTIEPNTPIIIIHIDGSIIDYRSKFNRLQPETITHGYNVLSICLASVDLFGSTTKAIKLTVM